MSILRVKINNRFWLSAVIFFCVIIFTKICTNAQVLYGPEYKVKAGFIYNFAKFIEWPKEDAGQDPNFFLICIVPDTPETDVFLSLRNKSIGNKKIKIEKYNDVRDKGIEKCQILFLDSKDEVFIRESLLIVKYRSILTIGHIKGFTQAGGIINFFTEEDRLRFAVNLDAADRARIRLGSQILMSAEIIKEKDN
ncbi:MAG: YfiR family protein [bacterium]